MNNKDTEITLITDLVKILQRLEGEIDLSVNDIKIIRRAKIYLGYNIPPSLGEGSGRKI